jgi:hypothetical protein
MDRRFPIWKEPTCQSCDHDQRRQACAAPEAFDVDGGARRGQRICARSAGCRLFYSVAPLARFVRLALRIYVLGKLRVFHVIGKFYVCLRDA